MSTHNSTYLEGQKKHHYLPTNKKNSLCQTSIDNARSLKCQRQNCLNNNDNLKKRIHEVKFSPSPHEYWCLSKSDILEKDREQWLQQYFFTAECVCKCARKLERSAKARWQLGHLYGFSPVCVRMWPCNNHGRLNAFPQIVHLHGSVCVRMCIFSAPKDTYVFSQYLHANSLRGCWCFLRAVSVTKLLSQSWHLCFLIARTFVGEITDSLSSSSAFLPM